jgi:group I intron endonuclease
MIGIYKITSPNGKVYIGQTIDHERRFKHYKLLRCKEQPRIYKSLLKYGVDNHKFHFIFESSIEQLTQWERHFQELYNSTGKEGLNCILVKTDEFSGGHSQETKDKISESLKGYKPSQKQIDRLIEYNKTRVISDETRYKLGNGNRGKKQSAENIIKRTIPRIGLKRSEEVKKNISNRMKLACTDEWRANLSSKLKGRVITDEWRKKLSDAAKNRNKSVNL